MIGEFMDSIAQHKFSTFFDHFEVATEEISGKPKAILLFGRKDGDWIRVSMDAREIAEFRVKFMDFCVRCPEKLSPLTKRNQVTARQRMKVIQGGAARFRKK